MSPESAGSLEVERYIGACLITQNNRSKKNKPEQFSTPSSFYPQNGYFQRCASVDGWAGGIPLISFNHRRQTNINSNNHVNSLTRLAVHTQGAPLILSKTYGPKKKPNSNTFHKSKVYENTNKKQEQTPTTKPSTDPVVDDKAKNLENCLPRIIKPRKRRKRERRPPHLNRPLSQDGFSTDSASPDADNNLLLTLSPLLPYMDHQNLETSFDFFGEIPEVPKLHHSFEDVEELTDVNGNQSTTSCQCKYCDPSGQIWDADKSCYSPFLTPPKTFDFSYFSPLPKEESMVCLAHSISSMSLEDDERKSVSRSSSNSSFSRDLEVSTEIVTSLNGHRDLEIKFFSAGSVIDKCVKNNGQSCDLKCDSGIRECAGGVMTEE